MPWWAVSMIQIAVATSFGWAAFRLGVIYGESREREKPRVVTRAQVLSDKLHVAYVEAKEAGNVRACRTWEDFLVSAKRGSPTWVIHRVFWNTRDVE